VLCSDCREAEELEIQREETVKVWEGKLKKVRERVKRERYSISSGGGHKPLKKNIKTPTIICYC